MFFLTLVPASTLYAGSDCVSITAPTGQHLDSSSIASLKTRTATALDSTRCADIIIYRLTTGIEIYTYNPADDSIKEETAAGVIKALVKIKQSGVLVKSIFITAEGFSEEDLLKALAEKVCEELK